MHEESLGKTIRSSAAPVAESAALAGLHSTGLDEAAARKASERLGRVRATTSPARHMGITIAFLCWLLQRQLSSQSTGKDTKGYKRNVSLRQTRTSVESQVSRRAEKDRLKTTCGNPYLILTICLTVSLQKTAPPAYCHSIRT